MTPWMKNTLSSDCVVEASPTTPPQLEKRVTSLRMVGGAQYDDVPSPIVGNRDCMEGSSTTPPQLEEKVTSLAMAA